MEKSTETNQNSFENLTYDEKITKLAAAGITTFVVRIHYPASGPDREINLKCSEYEAREFTLQLVEAARTLFDEYYNPLDEYLVETYPAQSERPNYWAITCFARFPQAEDSEELDMRPPSPRFLFGHRSGAYRVAKPDSKVFVYYAGKDCSHERWAYVRQYRSLHEAAEDCDSVMDNAEGPTGYSVITLDDYETITW